MELHPTVRVQVLKKVAAYSVPVELDLSPICKIVAYTLCDTGHRGDDAAKLLVYRCGEPGCDFIDAFWYEPGMHQVPQDVEHKLATHAVTKHND